MYEFVASYWWISIFSVPALAIAIKRSAERAHLVDSLAMSLQTRLSTLAFSYPDHWVVTATLRDGRRFSRVVISNRFQLVSQGTLPFELRDVAEIAWEGPGRAPEGAFVPLSDASQPV